jgi:chromosome segregation protein
MEIATSLRELEASIEGLKAEVLENEASVSEHQEKLYDIRNSINIKEQGIEHLKGKIKDVASQKQKNTAELELLRTRGKNLADEVETLAIMADESGVEIENVRNNVLQNQASLEELKTAAKALHAELEERKIEFFEIATEKAKAKNTLVSLGKGIEDIRKRKERDVREADENRERLAGTHQNLDSLMSALKTDEGTLENLTDSASMTSNELERAKNDLQLIDERISEMKDEAGRKSSRFASLRELQERYAWCSDGTKSIMQAKKVASPDMLPGETCLGLVADVLDVPREYETAVESVLGEKLQHMVVRSQRDGMLAIDYLKSSSSGRGTFVPLEVRVSQGCGETDRRGQCSSGLRENCRLPAG